MQNAHMVHIGNKSRQLSELLFICGCRYIVCIFSRDTNRFHRNVNRCGLRHYFVQFNFSFILVLIPCFDQCLEEATWNRTKLNIYMKIEIYYEAMTKWYVMNIQNKNLRVYWIIIIFISHCVICLTPWINIPNDELLVTYSKYFSYFTHYN